jgi:hypothetical protein
MKRWSNDQSGRFPIRCPNQGFDARPTSDSPIIAAFDRAKWIGLSGWNRRN